MRQLARDVRLLVVTSCAGCYGAAPTPPQNQPAAPRAPQSYDYPAICTAIADDIEQIARDYPQLADYDARSARTAECTISYDYHTHRATKGGGWAAGVPNPDPDGVWFHIGVWDPSSPEATMQINTQPVLPSWWIGGRRVTFLSLEGEQVKPVSSALLAILKRHGMTEK
jgi:hypothetical protein